jgi:hypothetical protein
MEEKKPKLFNRLGLIVKPIFRGALKSIPVINPVIEIVNNIRNETKAKEGQPVKTHSYISIVTQFICVGVVLYAFFSKQLPVDQVLELLKQFTGE